MTDSTTPTKRKASASPTRFGAQIVDTAPHPDKVDGPTMLASIHSALRRHVILTDEEAIAIALFVVFTFAHDAFQVSAILAVISPEKRCGKTRLLSVLFLLVRSAIGSSNLTPAVLYRCIAQYSPTLLLDEADTFLEGRSDFIGILNSGQCRSMARVIRSKPDSYEPEFFSTWCPKIIAKIGHLAPTLEDRSIVIPLRRKLPSEHAEPLRALDEEILAGLRSKVARWVADHLEELRTFEPLPPDELNDRAKDNWSPLLAIADVAGGEWPELARRAALVLSMGRAGQDEGSTRLLADIRDIFAKTHQPFMPSRQLVEALCGLDDAPWSDTALGRRLSGNTLANYLRGYRIHPKSNWVPIVDRPSVAEEPEKGHSVKGYWRTDFLETFKRYLPSLEGGESGEETSDSSLVSPTIHGG